MAFVHVLTTDCTIVIQRQGVTCLDEDTLLAQLLSAPCPKHLWYNIKEKQKAVGNKNKDAKEVESGSDMEIIDSPWPGTKRCKKHSPTGSTHHMCHQKMPPSSSPPTSPMICPSNPPLLLPRVVTHAEELTDPTALPTPEGLLPSWPYGMYTVDMVDSFTQIDSDELVKEQPLLADRFTTVFKALYKVTTYGDQKRKWKRGPQAQHEAALQGGRTPPGLWSVYCASI